MEKGTPTHDLAAIKDQFADLPVRLVSRAAMQSAFDLGFDIGQVMSVIHELRTADFVKSATQHSPPDPQIWHDTYNLDWVFHSEDGDEEIDRIHLYLKFAGRRGEPVTLTSFKENLDG